MFSIATWHSLYRVQHSNEMNCIAGNFKWYFSYLILNNQMPKQLLISDFFSLISYNIFISIGKQKILQYMYIYSDGYDMDIQKRTRENIPRCTKG